MENFPKTVNKFTKIIQSINQNQNSGKEIIKQNQQLIQALMLFTSILDDIDKQRNLQHLKNIKELKTLYDCISHDLKQIKQPTAQIKQIIAHEQYIIGVLDRWKNEAIKHEVMIRLCQNPNDMQLESAWIFDDNKSWSREEIYQTIFGNCQLPIGIDETQ